MSVLTEARVALLNAASLPIQAQADLDSAAILQLNSNPVQLVAAPAANELLYVVSAIFAFVPGVTPYDTNTHLQVIYGSYTDWPAADGQSGFLAQTDPGFLMDTAVSAAQGTYLLNSDVLGQALNVFVPDGDPLNGDGVARVTITYQKLAVHVAA